MSLDRDGVEVCVLLTGVYVPHVENGYYDPPEGGFVEDVVAEDETTGEEVILTVDEENEASRILFEGYDEGGWDE